MRGPLSAAEAHQIEELIAAVDDLRRRVEALEQTAMALPAAAARDASPALQSQASADVSSGLLAALGRLLLGVAGAYLLRAITEAGLLPQLAGTLVGLAYAAGWLVSTIRIPAANRLAVAIHGITAAAIVAPLLWESTVRFHSLSPVGAAASLALFVVLGQAFAWQRDHSMLAGVTALAGSATAIALITGTLNPVPFAWALALCAGIVELGAWRGRALGWRWIIALACDLCAILLLYLVTRPHGLPEGYAAIPVGAVGGLLGALVAIYIGSMAARTLLNGNSIAWFELLQVPASAALAIGGGLLLSRAVSAATGWACLALAGLCYAIALRDRVGKRSRNFHAYATFALVLAVTAGFLSFAGRVQAILWTALALSAIWLGTYRKGHTLATHGVVYLLAAAAASGLQIDSARLMLGLESRAASPLPAISAALGYALLLRTPKDHALQWRDRIPAALAAALLCWSWAGLAAGLVAAAHLDAPVASTLRTALVAIVAVTLAWCGRRWNLPELIWILFPWMFFGAMKLAMEDFGHGRPATLFLSLLVYGGTLIALPRLLRRRGDVRAG